jgi:aminoglycoside phosphotransferase (APT) family kinase protein
VSAPPSTLRSVGRGFTSDVFEWSAGRAVKLFHPSVPLEVIQRKYANTRAIFAAGLPSPAVHGLVTVNGRTGIVLDLVSGPTMLQAVQARPWTMLGAVRRLADLQSQILRRKCPDLPSFKDRLRRRIESAGSPPDFTEQALAWLAGLPDGESVCHGDIHPGNVIETANGPMVIDWDSATCGDPAGDVAITVRLFENAMLPTEAPRWMHCLLRLSRRQLLRSYLRRISSNWPEVRSRLRDWRTVVDAAFGS